MRHGIGSKAQRPVLLAARVGRLWLPDELPEVLAIKDIAPIAFRPGDTIVMVQPTLITSAIMRRLVKLTPNFEVIGHGPLDASSETAFQKLRRLEPMVKDAVEARKGPNTRYPQPTLAQIHVIVSYWHGSMKPGQYMPLVREMMQEPDLPQTAVRDWVVKWTGSVKRDPDAPGKRPLPPLEQ